MSFANLFMIARFFVKFWIDIFLASNAAAILKGERRNWDCQKLVTVYIIDLLITRFLWKFGIEVIDFFQVKTR